jgi:TetR/AcrR family fatty acid metabolism transcriptional regulator
MTKSKLNDPKQDIVWTAMHIMAHEGKGNFTTKALAKKLAITEPALYRHFSCKGDIYLGVMKLFSILMVDPTTLEGDALGKIASFMRQRLQLFSQYPDLGRLFVSDAILHAETELSHMLLGAIQITRVQIGGIIDEGKENGLIRAELKTNDCFRVVAGSICFTVTQWHMTTMEFDLMEAGESLIQSVVSMMKAR